MNDILNNLHYDEDIDQEAFLPYVEHYFEKNEQAFRFGESNCLLTPVIHILKQDENNTQSKATATKLRTAINNAIRMEPLFEQQGATPGLIQELCNKI